MASQHHLQQNLPTSVEDSYRKKCKDLKNRINEIESSNEKLTSRIQRARRAIQRMRLERAFLLQQLESRTEPRVSDSEGSPSPPPTVCRLSGALQQRSQLPIALTLSAIWSPPAGRIVYRVTDFCALCLLSL